MPSPCLTLSGGCLSLHWQAWRDGGADPWVVEVVREGCRIPFFRPPPLSTDPIPMPSYAPHFHQRGCSRGGHPGIDCHGCCGACSSSLSRLLQPPVCGLEDCGGRGVRSSTCPCSIASWTFRTFAWRPSSLFLCQSGRGIGWPLSNFRFLCIRNLVTSYALWLMAALTISQRCASICPRPRRSSLGLWLLYPLFFIPWVSVCVVTWTTGSSRHHPGRPSSGISGLSCPFVASWGSWSTRSSPTSVHLRWYIISGWSSTQGLLWLLHRQIASPGYGLPPTNSVLRSASCQLVAVVSGDAVLSVTSGSRGPPAEEFAPDLPSNLDPSASVPWSLDCLRDLRWWLRGDRFCRGVSLLQVSPVLDFWSDASDVG